MSDYDPGEDWSPASWLGAYASVLCSDYLSYWEIHHVPEGSELTPEQRQYFRHLYELAEAVIPCMHSLASDRGVADKVRQLFEGLGATSEVDADLAAKVAKAMQSHPIIRDAIKIDLALWAADGLLKGAERRAPELVALVAHRALSPRAAAFLDRATRLYLWGFEPETIVMCASVLEAAYESRFDDAEMRRLGVPMKDQGYGASDRERAALLARVFTREEKERAAKLRRARNDTLHNAPNTALGAVEALRTTAALLDRLFPSVTN